MVEPSSAQKKQLETRQVLPFADAPSIGEYISNIYTSIKLLTIYHSSCSSKGFIL